MELILSSFGNIFATVALMFSVAGDIWYLVFPLLFYVPFYHLWKHHVEEHYFSKMKYVLLEIIPPRDLEKSPLPMESIFWGFAGVMKTLTMEEYYIKGERPVSFSLEIVGIDGNAHFFVRTQANYRNLVEAHFYAQYPDIEMVEREDYVLNVPRTIPNEDWDLWGTEFKFVREDLYPLRTYKYFEETVTGKMIDPLAGMVEIMGQLAPGEQIWYQLLITPYVESWSEKEGMETVQEFLGQVKKKGHGPFMRLVIDMGDIFANVLSGLFGREPVFKSEEKEGEESEAPVEFRLTPGEKKVLEALQQNMAKQQFLTKIRFIYLAKREAFKKPHVSAFVGAIKQFNDFNLNSIMSDSNFKTYSEYVWKKPRLRYRQRKILDRYIRRNSDPQSTRIMLSTEELATLFHIPDMVITSPSLVRVVAKRGGAPANLPLQVLE